MSDLATYPRSWVRPVTKADALAYLDRLREKIDRGPELTEFPEGELGVALHAIVELAAEECPDLGDFAHVREACETVLRASFASATRDFPQR